MNIFIAVDMEGATGVTHHDQLMPDGKTYSAACKLLTGDVNAVIEGILATEPQCSVIVGDGHGIMRNVILEQLHPMAELVVGPAAPQNKPLCQLEGISASADMLFMVGYHSRAGYPNGLLAHTYVGSLIRNFRLNRAAVGEITVNAAIAASFGATVGLVSGNSDLAEEAENILGENGEFVCVKSTLGPTAAICKTPAKTADLLREAAIRAVVKFKEGKLKSVEPAKVTIMEVETYRRESVDRALTATGLYRTGECSFETSDKNAAEAFRRIWSGIARALDEPAAWLR
ncbi:hypothetical protein MASR2M18_12660 [Ignavibacteria bacterium]|nr:M55 family metallopeptidase [Bacteroidota bacterium]MCZ2132219.1 M55 family metallopeptidase [Bacteroidota bacterium]